MVVSAHSCLLEAAGLIARASDLLDRAGRLDPIAHDEISRNDGCSVVTAGLADTLRTIADVVPVEDVPTRADHARVEARLLHRANGVTLAGMAVIGCLVLGALV